ncbi:MAG TPA: hypothetical protein VEW48_14990 [Thermoanaerobaculia bacterium]|nr:hypothetical protein [Thermoanaerobaculia bacterium]
MDHPSKEVLLGFVLGAASRQENRMVVRHLLARCPACAATLRKLRQEPPLSPPPDPGAYDPAIDRLATLLERLARPPAPEEDDGEGDLLQSTVTSGSAARRRWLFG